MAVSPIRRSAAETRLSKRPSKLRQRKNLRLETLEDRNLMAISPTLVAVIPNAGGLIQNGEPARQEAPTQLTFRFDEGQIIQRSTILGNSGIVITRSGGDGVFGNANDVVLVPGFKDIGDRPNEVVVRFSSPLPDDHYRITLIGAGPLAITNTDPDLFNNGVNQQVNFELDLGAQVVAVVPQPITRVGNTLTQARNQIVVYFNNDDLNPATAQNTAFYQLIFTNDSASNIDDAVYFPTNVAYNAATDTAVLTFANDLALLGSGSGNFRLRVGSAYNTPASPNTFLETETANDTFNGIATALPLGAINSQATVVRGEIAAQHFLLDLPGSPLEPGHRETAGGTHLGASADAQDGIAVQYYNFLEVLATDGDGFPSVSNVITPAQRERGREAFEMWGRYLGINFVETADQGWTIATGDMLEILGGPVSAAGAPLFATGIGPHLLPTLVVDVADPWGNSEYGGGYFEAVMSGIGELMGLGPTFDLPGLNLMGSTTAAGNPQGASLSTTPNIFERVFPGDGDIIHGQYLFRPESKDIDVYSFTLPSAGRVKLETVAERLTATSLLDSVITVYNSDGQIVARNDDYFSEDSYLELNLGSGTFYVAVSSTGNIDYDLNLPDSGFGGTTQGVYDLRITFNQEQTSGIFDTTGTLLDGDLDGKSGGAYNFWFTVATQANTIYVDKAATSVVGVLGSIGRPYTVLSSALSAATPGQVVRIVGNGGADNNLATLGDNKAYEVGFAEVGAGQAPLSDGTTFRVPRGVSVMIDAGAIFKLRRANIDVGSLSQGIDRSEGSLQVLGTPVNKVQFTSFHNETVGVDTYALATTPLPGDWGGIVFRNELDYDEGRTVLETEGIFLNYVNNANITYGGGDVLVASNQLPFSAIHLVKARPTISFNTITLSAQAAISADPNSFEESRYYDQANTFELTYGRVGPDIDLNTVSGNTYNGLFVRVDTLAGEPIKQLEVAARFDDNIVHILTETLNIHGTPGGPGGPDFTPLDETDFGTARTDARLKIDAGTVVKLRGARIEAQMGTQLIAEGSDLNPIIFTSLLDNRYGASGAFATTTSNSAPVPGNWSGLYFGPNSSGSIDHALITYAGGASAIEGRFVDFNAVEIHQADVRIANSTLENNDLGVDPLDGNRNGRGRHDPTTIFVRGAQPIIVNNVVRDNAASVMSINVNALNGFYNSDWGRTSGPINLFADQRINQGPLIRLNRLSNNQLNGLEVRGATLTTESVWDDTDIVHIVTDEIDVPNFHTYGGLRLQSSPTESLVVKLQGANAGFTAGGRAFDITDRIGGTVQIVGFPGQPVVLTSLLDDGAGAGLDLNGFTVFDTNNDGNATTPAPGDWRSVRLDKFSNDRNVVIINENERVVANLDINGSTLTAQNLGQLARNEKESDDNLRLGFEVNGYLASTAPGDVDVYSFIARPGTEVWLDLDLTRIALDSVVELIDAEGNVVAKSENSLSEQLGSLPNTLTGVGRILQRDTFQADDFYSFNRRDAGMRVVLPGAVGGAATTYYVRVRSNSTDLNDVTGGTTTGQYRLQVRLRAIDEKPGSTVQFADIRYATNGIEVLGQPGHSPLIGETAESTNPNDTFATAQFIGNLLTSDRNAIALAGSLQANAADVDWYQMNVSSPVGSQSLISTIFDIDYADQLGRPDLRLSVFDSTGALVLMVNNSNVADDRPGPQAGNNLDDLSRGTVGGGDPFIGPANLLVGTYFVAVTHAANIPSVLSNPAVRLEPVNSTNRVIEDHVTTFPISPSISSEVGRLFDADSLAELNAYAEDFHLGDVVFYVSTGSDLFAVDPFTGYVEYDVTGQNIFLPDSQNNTFISYRDIAMRNDGRLYSLTVGNNNGNLNQNNISGNYRELSTFNGSLVSSVDDQIVTYQANPADPIDANGNPNLVVYNTGVQFEALAHEDSALRRVYAVGNITPPGLLVPNVRNLLYILDASGVVIDDQTDPDPNDAASPTDARPRGRLLTGPTLIPPNATDTVSQNAAGTVVDPNFVNPGDLLDGSRFTITDSDGTVLVFEFDSGPDVIVNNFGAEAVRDGNTFIMGDGVNTFTFEYDSGRTLVLPPGATAVSMINDGDTFTIIDDQVPTPVGITFQFDSDGSLTNSAHTGITFQDTDTRAALVTAITNAINAAAFNASADPSTGGANLGRISITGDVFLDTGVVGPRPGMQFEGDYGLTNLAHIPIQFEEGDVFNVFGANTIAAVEAQLSPIRGGYDFRTGSTVVPGTTGDRLTFFGGQNADFTGTPAFTHRNTSAPATLSATGIRITSNIAVPFDAGDSSFDLAAAIANAINSAGVIFPAFTTTATVVGDSVELGGTTGTPTVDAGSPVFSGGNGPGGTVTGLTFVGNTLYAVTDAGGLYIVNNPTAYQTTPGTGPSLQYVASSATDLNGLDFTGLSLGPQNVEGGVYSDILFATTSDGRVYAFDTDGELQPIFLDGATFIDTGIIGLQGLAFSPIDYNLWHVTDARGNDQGHGVNAAYDTTRRSTLLGGTSFYFGLENPNLATTISNQPGAGNYLPRGTSGSGAVVADGNAGVFQTYDVPGGAYGGITTDSFSLQNYSSTDQPVFYFSYYYDVEANAARDEMRVYISADGGANWDLLTNSLIRANADNQWRQARLGLGAYAGEEDLRLRFEFQSSGDSNVGQGFLDGARDTTGSFIRAIPGSEIDDGFVVVVGGQQLEFDMGFSLLTPAGAGSVLVDGDTFEVTGPLGTATFEFNKTGGTVGVPVNINDLFSAADVALAIEAAVNAAGLGVTARAVDNRVQLEGATDVQASLPMQVTGDAPGTIGFFSDLAMVANVDMTADEIAFLVAQAIDQVHTGGRNLTAPAGAALLDTMTFTLNDGNQTITFEFEDTAIGDGVAIGNYQVDFDAGDTAATVAAAIRAAIDDANLIDGLNITATGVGATVTLNGPVVFFDPGGTPITANGNYDDPNIFTSSKVDGSLVRVIGHSVGFFTDLPFFAPDDPPDLPLPGDARGNTLTDPFLQNTRGADNRHEGVYLDAFIIGFAERGEMVTGAPGNTTAFNGIANPPPGGAYDLEIRTATDYTIFQPAPIDSIIVRQWDTNDRVTNGYALQAFGGAGLSEGETFIINDGVRVVTYEYDSDTILANPLNRPVTYTAFMTDAQVASAIVAAISATKTAGLSTATAATITNGNIVYVFGAASIDALAVDITSVSLLEERFTGIGNDTIATAAVSGLTSINRGSITLDGRIGDNANLDDPGLDVDFISVQLNAGESLIVDTDSDPFGAYVDTIITLYDAFGFFPIDQVDDDYAPGESQNTFDSYLEFIAPAAGTYYIAISSFPNSFFDPTVEGSGFAGGLGDYTVTIHVGEGSGVLHTEYQYNGDSNRFRDQGYTILNGNRISHALNYGISVDEATPDAGGNQPHPAPVRTLREENTLRLVPGVSIVNNILFELGDGGIRLGGDDPIAAAAAGGPIGASLFARVVNNTIYGSATPIGTGILVENGSYPTILNNVFANLDVGIEVDFATGANAEIAGSAYSNNNLNTSAGVPLGQSFIQVPVGNPLFVNPAAGNFYPASQAAIIDSSINSFQERAEMTTVTAPLAISVSPILAPSRDAYGLLRVNDTTVMDAEGLGSQVYKDRGAIDRADTVGPTASLVNPVDNDAGGRDVNPADTIVQYVGPPLTSFAIQLVDGVQPVDPAFGVGIDDSTVSAASFTVTKDGLPLTQGIDFIFSYNSTNDTIRIEPTTGFWLPGSYVVTLDNSVATGIKDLAGNTLKPNQVAGGTTQFTIALPSRRDFGDAPNSYGTVLLNNGARHTIVDGIHLGNAVSEEFDGLPPPQFDTFDDGVTFTTTINPGQNATVSISVSAIGKIDAFIDFDGNGNFLGATEKVLNSVDVTTGVNIFVIPIPAGATQNINTWARFRFSSSGGLGATGDAPNGEVEDYPVHIERVHPWQNSPDRFDVNNDGKVSIADKNALAYWLQFNPLGLNPVLPVPAPAGFPAGPLGNFFVDVNGDDLFSIPDVLALANRIRFGPAPEGEGEGEGAGGAFAPSGFAGAEGEGDLDSIPSWGQSGSSSGSPISAPEGESSDPWFADGELDDEPTAVPPSEAAVADLFFRIENRFASRAFKAAAAADPDKDPFNVEALDLFLASEIDHDGDAP